MPELPTELLLRISNFIPEDELPALIGVSLTFYNLVLDLRYSKIRLETVDARTERRLQRLRRAFHHSVAMLVSMFNRDPVPASRVRQLFIHLPATAAAPEPPLTPSLLERIFSGTAQKPPASSPSTEHLIESLILVFPGLVNLTCFEFEAWDMAPEHNLQRFFRSAWAAFGRQLRTLSVGGRPKTYRQIVASKPELVSCTALSLQFAHESEAKASAAVEDIMVESVAPFINGLSSHLESLKIWSLLALDLSALFLHLGHFPRLHDFHLLAQFNNAFSNPMGLTGLLEVNSSSLDTVTLRLNPAGNSMDPSTEQQLAQWLLSHQAHPSVMRNLKTLNMYPTTLSSGFDALVMYLQRSTDSLTSLAVKDRYLSLDEVETLLSPVAHRVADDGLKSLRLNVRAWSADLFDLLASRLPGLKSLSLYVGGSQPHHAATKLFFAGMENRSFKSWKLYDIGVWQGGSEVLPGTMRLLADCIPSIQSFWGNGHMLGDRKTYE
ncbi:hypothetical protein GGX14DRAFT_629141 [Mycena pura]|uniref:F-box domain-containing protein n=1 Tax=Mycena pura TaxID=153505 RepID=A0AAD6YRN8_9AGAR|nr:hypothetical protein GGX14DRAFT_629141 [Mycena pura]